MDHVYFGNVVWIQVEACGCVYSFLHGDLGDVDIYMDIPEGMEHKLGECLKLEKTIYGLVQSARVYWQKTCKVFEDVGFE